MKKLINRIKTLYWFWQLTKDVDDKWFIQTGINPNGSHFMEAWTKDRFFVANKNWQGNTPYLQMAQDQTQLVRILLNKIGHPVLITHEEIMTTNGSIESEPDNVMGGYIYRLLSED